jgi:hypothetical protein
VIVTRGAWWILLLTTLFIIAAWPPDEGRSLIMKGVNWTADPSSALPILPEQLGFGVSDDPIAVEERDAEVRRYDALYNSGGFMRMRLQLKVAEDPFDRTTERQLLLVVGAVVVFGAVRWGAARSHRL